MVATSWYSLRSPALVSWSMMRWHLLLTSDVWRVDVSTSFDNFELFVALWQSKLAGRWSMCSSFVVWITVTVSSDPPVLSTYTLCNRCWTQLPSWSFENKNLVILQVLYETSYTGYWFYRGTTINYVYTFINAYIGQCRHISSISSWMTPLGSGNLTCPRTKFIRYGDHSFGVSGTKIWNQFPVDLWNSSLRLHLYTKKLNPLDAKLFFAKIL